MIGWIPVLEPNKLPLHVLPVPVRSLNRVKPLLILVEQSELTLSYRRVLLVRNRRPQDAHAFS